MLKQDLIMRMIEQLGAAAARLLNKARKGQHEEALDDLGALYDDLLRLDPWMVRAMDIDSLASLLRSPQELPMLAALMAHEATLLAPHDPARALHVGQRALGLFARARAAQQPISGPCAEALAALTALPTLRDDAAALLLPPT